MQTNDWNEIELLVLHNHTETIWLCEKDWIIDFT